MIKTVTVTGSVWAQPSKQLKLPLRSWNQSGQGVVHVPINANQIGHIETRNRGGSTICILCIFESIELHRHRRFALCTVAALPNLFASFTVIAMLRTSRWRQVEPLAQWRALARCLELLRWPASSDGVVLREEVLDTLLRSWSCVCPGL